MIGFGCRSLRESPGFVLWGRDDIQLPPLTFEKLNGPIEAAPSGMDVGLWQLRP